MKKNITPAVEAQNLGRVYHTGHRKVEVLKDVSFALTPGEKTFLVGESGAGKTTLLYILAGLERPDTGRVMVGGESFYAGSARKQAEVRNRVMGYVFQNFQLLPDFTALENVLLPSRISGKSADSYAREILDRIGLGNRSDHLPAELSGGEQQRVAIARALVNRPDVIFADEPTGNLDSETGSVIMDLLLQLVSESGKTLLVVTHDREMAKRGDRCLQLAAGQLMP